VWRGVAFVIRRSGPLPLIGVSVSVHGIYFESVEIPEPSNGETDLH
jgi:hypothetical protein